MQTNQTHPKLRIAMCSWEIGRQNTGLGAKVGGVGAVIEELPDELVKAAKKLKIDVEIELLSPCFAYYDKKLLTICDSLESIVAKINEKEFEFQVFQHTFEDGHKSTYFWNEELLDWTIKDPDTGVIYIYPEDPQMGLELYSAVCQAMASYIKNQDFHTIHLHDYHAALVPFYLNDKYLQKVPVHFTIHNATYQGMVSLINGGFSSLDRINLSGEKLFHKYFDVSDHLNLLKAGLLKVHETGGKITTVSGDIEGTWGYAAEVKQNPVFEKLPIAGITNGMGEKNKADQMPELNGVQLSKMQLKKKDPFFKNPYVQKEMLTKDHNFDEKHLEVKHELKKLLNLETFAEEPTERTVLMTVVGRLVEQKNLGLVADIMESVLEFDPDVKFIILASAPKGDVEGKKSEDNFNGLQKNFPKRVYFNKAFNQPLSKLILAGGDFCLIPSKFEPCGLVDYEAALVGNIPICRSTGGLVKIRDCGYLYKWLDIGDRKGEINAFYEIIKEAIHTYRNKYDKHQEMIKKAMRINATWDRSAKQYIIMYKIGLLEKQWRNKEQEPIEALKQKSKDFRNWISGGHDVSPGLIEAPCPKCGDRVVCAYAEMGMIDFYDTYAHVCLDPECDYGETKDFFFHCNWGPDGPRPDCPFCDAIKERNSSRPHSK